jgi:hypothetical protein
VDQLIAFRTAEHRRNENELQGNRMPALMRLLLLVAVCWLALGCLALAGLTRAHDNQLTGWMLMVPAMLLGLLTSPGWLYTVSDGWAVLTLGGVMVVYFVPGLLLSAVGLRAAAVTRRAEPRQ